MKMLNANTVEKAANIAPPLRPFIIQKTVSAAEIADNHDQKSFLDLNMTYSFVNYISFYIKVNSRE